MRTSFLAAAVVLAMLGACKAHKDDAGTPPAADNTAQNKRDPQTAPTADKAVDTKSDLDITQKIRKAVMDDGSLGTNAHNCKIVVQDGKVSLVGPVANAAEATKVQQIAASVVGDANVTNKLEVTN